MHYRLKGADIHANAAVSPMTANGRLSKLSIGKGSFIGRVTLHLHEPISIGEHVVVNDDVTIFTASHDVNSPEFRQTSAAVRIDDYAWIATGAMLLPGVIIGKGAIVGAGAVVTKNVEPYQVVAGNPAKVVRQERSKDLRYNPVMFLAAYEAWKSNK